MKRFLFYIALIICIILLQLGVFMKLSFGGIVPNLFVLVTAAIGMLHGKKEGCMIGFILGLLMDCLYGSVFGSNALILAVIGYITGHVRQIFYEEDMTLPLVIIGISDIIYGIYVYICSFLSRGRFDFFFYLRKIILPETVYTLILAVFVYRLISWISHKLNLGGSDSYFV